MTPMASAPGSLPGPRSRTAWTCAASRRKTGSPRGAPVLCVRQRQDRARLARAMLALPVPVFGLFFGREWFVEPGAAPTTTSGEILGIASGQGRADLV